MTGDPTERRDVCVQRRENTVQTIQDNHRSYNSLQYPLIFWEGKDGFHLNIKQRNSTADEELIKKVSAMNFYAYRLMIRANEDNNILRCRQLFHQYIIDMYAKIESEGLRYIKFKQAKLRSEEYVSLRDGIIGNVDATNYINNIGTAYILPSSYSGSPRHMHDYIQDVMIYVREYGRPDLFITFTCNPNWEEIKNLLLSGQTSMHRHDVTARVFKQKLKSLINLITHHLVFGETSCWLYSVEWQKRRLPNVHILIWLVAKVRPEEIDKIISEIPDPNVDQELFTIVTANMINGPCGTLNMMSPCMDNGKCTKRFPKPCQTDTITNIDGYPSYRRRNVDNGG
ncbi:helitron_like_N domain-containing protein [Trichonephila clavipes]|nr:helitron_like_N domain-containing protein [Trichonephila clavipes]